MRILHTLGFWGVLRYFHIAECYGTWLIYIVRYSSMICLFNKRWFSIAMLKYQRVPYLPPLNLHISVGSPPINRYRPQRNPKSKTTLGWSHAVVSNTITHHFLTCHPRNVHIKHILNTSQKPCFFGGDLHDTYDAEIWDHMRMLSMNRWFDA